MAEAAGAAPSQMAQAEMPELQNCPSLGMLSLRAVAPVATTTLCARACDRPRQ